jgi:sugar phosphate isomerase/epimerase
MKFGIKTNLKEERLADIKKLSKIYDFVETYFLPENVTPGRLSSIKTRWIMHSPHEPKANIAKKVGSGIELIKKSILYAIGVNAKKVIVHPGSSESSDCSIKNAIKNLREINSFSISYGIRMIIENLPFRDEFCPGFLFGSKPEEIKLILDEVNCGFVLDFSHAYHSSFSHNIDPEKMIKRFMELKPEMFHLYDTEINQENDIHLQVGEGNLNFQFVLPLIKDKDVTLELEPFSVEVFTDAINRLKKISS